MLQSKLDPDTYNEDNLNNVYKILLDKPVRITTIDGTTYRGILYTINTDDLSFIIDKPVIERCCAKVDIPPYNKKLLIPSTSFYKLEAVELNLPLVSYDEANKKYMESQHVEQTSSVQSTETQNNLQLNIETNSSENSQEQKVENQSNEETDIKKNENNSTLQISTTIPQPTNQMFSLPTSLPPSLPQYPYPMGATNGIPGYSMPMTPLPMGPYGLSQYYAYPMMNSNIPSSYPNMPINGSLPPPSLPTISPTSNISSPSQTQRNTSRKDSIHSVSPQVSQGNTPLSAPQQSLPMSPLPIYPSQNLPVPSLPQVPANQIQGAFNGTQPNLLPPFSYPPVPYNAMPPFPPNQIPQGYNLMPQNSNQPYVPYNKRNPKKYNRSQKK